MEKHYMISTCFANYQLHCTEAEAMTKFQHFCKVYPDIGLYEWMEKSVRRIAEFHR